MRSLLERVGRGKGKRGKRGWHPAPFIVGVSRSGTTLLRLMLDAHPDLAIPPETHFIPNAVRASANSKDPHRDFLEAVVTDNPRWKDYRIDANHLRERIDGVRPFDTGEAIRVFYETYVERFDKPRWGDKTPAYCRSMQLISRVLPEARFVHLIRDGRDVALSTMRAQMGPQTVEKWAERWKLLIERAREAAESLGEAYMEVRYENLISSPELVLKDLCAFVDLPWDTTMLRYQDRAAERVEEINQDLPRRTGKQRVAAHALTSHPPQKSRVAAWKTEMTREQVVSFEKVAGAMLTELGYERMTRR